MSLNHIAFLPDGNRRWAKMNNLPVHEGHERGLLIVIPKMVESSFKKGIHTVTIFPFSTENWSRSKEEVGVLMEINSRMLDELSAIAKNNSARIMHLGRRDRLPKFLIKQLSELETASKKSRKHVLNVALDYGGIDEISRAVTSLYEETRGEPERFTKLLEKGLNPWLDTAGQPHPTPDFIIRTAERRLSGFMVYQATYSELFFSPLLWPDFTNRALEEALEDFSKRQRTYGY
ncbi:MAG TPA: polyprenyl diphosphate synthase [Candidatus Binatia bacterium]|nr:polyprenyl diphosphate synthase [Candidatus Binatia bacterium]